MFRRKRHLPAGPLTTRANALAIVAARNECHALRALGRDADAVLLDAWADQTERETFKVRPLVRRSERTREVVRVLGAEKTVASYVNGEDKCGGAA